MNTVAMAALGSEHRQLVFMSSVHGYGIFTRRFPYNEQTIYEVIKSRLMNHRIKSKAFLMFFILSYLLTYIIFVNFIKTSNNYYRSIDYQAHLESR